jgi:hypothetical protein
MAHMVKCLSSKYGALNSNPSITKKKERKINYKFEWGRTREVTRSK